MIWVVMRELTPVSREAHLTARHWTSILIRRCQTLNACPQLDNINALVH